MRRQIVTLAVVTLVCIGSAALAGKKGGGGGGSGSTPGKYTLVQLDSGAGNAHGINNQGEIVGDLTDLGTGQSVPFCWSANASSTFTRTLLDLGAATAGSARDINNDGLIVGESSVAGVRTGTVWRDKNSSPRTLPVPAGTGPVRVKAVNDNGVIVGSFKDANGNTHAAAWAVREDNSIAGPLDLGYGSLNAERTTVGSDINNTNTMVGTLDDVATRWQLAWDGNSLKVLGSAPLFLSAELISMALGINDAGDICGSVQVAESNSEAFLLMQLEGLLIDMPLPESDSRRQDTQNLEAAALNNAATPQIIGKRNVLDVRQRVFLESVAPVLWQGDQAMNLEEAIPFFLGAGAINDNGWIAGRGYDFEGVLFPIVVIPN